MTTMPSNPSLQNPAPGHTTTPPSKSSPSESEKLTHSPFTTPPFSASVSQRSIPISEDAISNLSVARLNGITKHLWIAGRPQASSLHKSPLHRLKATGSEFVIYEQADLHLLWRNGMIYLKPLPRFLLNYEFWRDELCDDGKKDWDKDRVEIYMGALGLLYSYTWLIRWESDLSIAQSHNLVPKELDFETWMEIRSSFHSTFKRASLPYPWLRWRYDWSELRLNRINLIWRLRPNSATLSDRIRGYSNSYRIYSSFLAQNFSSMIIIFVYVTVILTAMQLGLATSQLEGSPHFQTACVVFAVFCILIPVLVLALVIVLLGLLFAFNWAMTKRHLKGVARRGGEAD
ncbi:hypothetical protein HYALB_00003717 [Hymenoscyphus albidus]|uniref:Uncharacterized protein n=1 Tax=Hymenoscyphus albidus TaxID=595503 RepID=A0A9N9QAU2_9HELO|nr:hypothetical protein HYALB_00003717 [Hymenoscyphus albidus]